MKIYINIVVFSFAMLVSLINAQTAESVSVHILGTTNVNGETDPCGWKKKPLGGLARKATIVDELVSSNNEVAIVDAGNLFFKKDQLSPGVTTEIASVTADIILNAFNEIGCDAFSPGSQDFALGLDFLLKMEFY